MPSPISVLAIIHFPLLISCVSGLKNVNNLQQFIATEKIKAEFYTSVTYANIYDDCTQDPSIVYLGDLSIATVLEYDQVDFGYGVQRVSLRVVNLDSSAAVVISMHLSVYTSTPEPPFLTIPINFTSSDKCTFVTLDVALEEYPAGKQNLYITIPSGEGGQLYLDWFQFNQTSKEVTPATEIIQAEVFDYAESMTVIRNCSDITVYSDDNYESYIQYNRVDFGIGVQSVRVRVSTTRTSTNTITFSLVDSDTSFATVTLNSTGGNCNFTEVSADVTLSPTGVQNLGLYYAYIYVDSFVFVREAGKFNATEKIEAEDYTSAMGVSLFEDCSDPSISYVEAQQTNSQLEYDGVDFGSGVETVTLRVSSNYTGPPLDIALHVGTSTSTPFVTVPVGQTGSATCDFYTVITYLDTRPTGLQKLFFTFPSAQVGYLHLDWFQFNQTVN